MSGSPAWTVWPAETLTLATRPGAGALSVATCPGRGDTVPIAPSVSVNGCGVTTIVCAATTGFASASVRRRRCLSTCKRSRMPAPTRRDRRRPLREIDVSWELRGGCEGQHAKFRRRDPRGGEIVDVLAADVARRSLRLENVGQRRRPFAIRHERHRTRRDPRSRSAADRGPPSRARSLARGSRARSDCAPRPAPASTPRALCVRSASATRISPRCRLKIGSEIPRPRRRQETRLARVAVLESERDGRRGEDRMVAGPAR